jgi:GH15 family glucan-1,4-alpha-glucosidase
VRTEDGYAAIRDYAIVGDGRTAALVARDGSIDWLCTPNFDSPSVFAALLDADRGGAFRITPAVPFEATRRYADGTNVLETTFRASGGTVRVTDAMCVVGDSLAPMRELVRKVDALEGSVPLDIRFEPRFGYAARKTQFRTTLGRLVATSGSDAVALTVDGCRLEPGPGGARGRVELRPGESALLDLSLSSKEPIVFAGREDAEERLERTRGFWTRWSGRAEYEGRWRDAVIRSILLLKLLVYSPSGAIIAAPTTSLPEEIGGVRNWDYRFTWLRDASWTIDALLQLGYAGEARSFLWWFMHASRLTHPRLEVLYTVNGSNRAPERDLGLTGHRRSRPVRVGNGALAQQQLDVYGEVLHAVWLYVRSGHKLDKATAGDVAQLADWVAEHWEDRDCGIWEVRSQPQHFVQSKAALWVALDRASRLAECGAIPDRSGRWERAARAIREFVDEHGWDEALGAYIRAPTLRELDASLLTLPLLEWAEPDDERVRSTINAVRRQLGMEDSPLLYRYRGEDGVAGTDGGAFLTCSFWLVDALARTGRVEEAIETMDELIGLANDVGLYSEEIDPATREFLGNFPQALPHLALINAAVSVANAEAKQ